MALEKISKSVEITETIISLLKGGKINKAKKYYENRMNHLELSYQSECLGHFSYFFEEFQDAIYRYENSISLNPDRVVARYQYLIGLFEFRNGNHTAAFDRYQYAIENDPNLVEAYEAMGDLMSKIGKREAAEKCFSDAELARHC